MFLKRSLAKEIDEVIIMECTEETHLCALLQGLCVSLTLCIVEEEVAKRDVKLQTVISQIIEPVRGVPVKIREI